MGRKPKRCVLCGTPAVKGTEHTWEGCFDIQMGTKKLGETLQLNNRSVPFHKKDHTMNEPDENKDKKVITYTLVRYVPGMSANDTEYTCDHCSVSGTHRVSGAALAEHAVAHGKEYVFDRGQPSDDVIGIHGIKDFKFQKKTEVPVDVNEKHDDIGHFPFLQEPIKVSNKRAEILNTAESLINGDRADTYGPPEVSFGRIADLFTASGFRMAIPGADVGSVRDINATDVAIALAQLKISRIISSPDHEDSWVDLAGYAGLGGEIACGGAQEASYPDAKALPNEGRVVITSDWPVIFQPVAIEDPIVHAIERFFQCSRCYKLIGLSDRSSHSWNGHRTRDFLTNDAIFTYPSKEAAIERPGSGVQ